MARSAANGGGAWPGSTCSCPGDYAAVQRQCDILAASFEPDEFPAQPGGRALPGATWVRSSFPTFWWSLRDDHRPCRLRRSRTLRPA